MYWIWQLWSRKKSICCDIYYSRQETIVDVLQKRCFYINKMNHVDQGVVTLPVFFFPEKAIKLLKIFQYTFLHCEKQRILHLKLCWTSVKILIRKSLFIKQSVSVVLCFCILCWLNPTITWNILLANVIVAILLPIKYLATLLPWICQYFKFIPMCYFINYFILILFCYASGFWINLISLCCKEILKNDY